MTGNNYTWDSQMEHYENVFIAMNDFKSIFIWYSVSLCSKLLDIYNNKSIPRLMTNAFGF